MQVTKTEIILAIVSVVSILFAIFALRRNKSDSRPNSVEETYITKMDSLKRSSDSIKEKIKVVERTNDTIKTKIVKIKEDEKKTDYILDNGSWDSNIKFLTDYLSKKGVVGK